MARTHRRVVSKSAFKARALEYFREVQRTGRDLVITDNGKPVVKVVAYAYDPSAALASLRGSVLRFDAPTEPVATEDWDALR